MIAQDIVTPTPFITSTPSLGLVATDVNNVTTAPTITTQTFVVNLNPTINVANVAICSGVTHTFNPTGANTYTISGGLFTVTPTTTTNYTLTATALNNCTSTTVATISVNITPTITVNSGAVCSGNSFTINPTGANTYTYSGNGTNVQYPGSLLTTYTVTGLSIEGCKSNDAVSSVTVNNRPTVTINNVNNSTNFICSGQSFTMIAGGANTYTFSSGTSVVTPTSTTNYTLTGTSAEGCVAGIIATCSVVVNALPSLTLTASQNTVCNGAGAITLNGLPSNGTTMELM